jgi:hypothetical protein
MLSDDDETSEEEGDVGKAYDEEQKEWMHGTDGTPQDLFVDGALSLGSLQQPQPSYHQWISHEVMKVKWQWRAVESRFPSIS